MIALNRAKLLFIIVVSFCVLLSNIAFGSINIVTDNPVVYMWLHQIGGVRVNVTTIVSWKDYVKGIVTPTTYIFRKREKLLRNADCIVFLTFIPQIKSLYVYKGINKMLHFLIPSRMVPEKELYRLLFDPATVPFLWDRILKILVLVDRDGYYYYQRRLAELEGRWRSLLRLSKKLLSSAPPILDLTGAISPFLTAVGVKKIDVLKLKDLSRFLKNYHGIVALDFWSDKQKVALLEKMTPENENITIWKLSPPQDGAINDYILFLLDNVRLLASVGTR